MKKIKENSTNGITLIALVITIIVLLILAGVSIAFLVGDNGILKYTTNAKEKNEIAIEKEQIQIALLDYKIDDKRNKYELIEKETKEKIINKQDEYVLKGEIIELESGNKYLITEDKVEYIEEIENAILLKGATFAQDDESWWKNNKLVGQNIYSREQVESTHIVNNKNIPEDVIYSWDISEKQDKSVMSWITDENKNGLYEWYIGAKYRVKANKYMTSYFSNLTNCLVIDGLEYLDVSETKRFRNLFVNSSSLKELNLSTWNTKNVIDMISVFQHCKSLEKIKLDSWNTENVENMVEMFYNCSSLKEIDLSNFNTEKVGSMARMFTNCISLEKVNVKSFNTSNVKDMNSMFNYVKALKKLDLSNFETEKVKSFNAMFMNASIMEELDISKFTINDNTDLMNFLGNLSPSIKIYVKDIATKNKIIENSKLKENNILIKE